MRRNWIMTVASLLLSVVVVAAQAGQCTDIIQTAMTTAEEACHGVARNQACFGHIALEATAQPDATNFEFSDVGDLVGIADIQSLELAGYDSETGAWGVVLMQIQANLPNTLPGQNVTVVLFGDTTLRNAATSVVEQIPPEQEQTVSATGAINVRTLPNTTSLVIGSLNPGVAITATGRTEDSQWIRVSYEERVGWIAAFLLQSEDNLQDLLVVAPDAQQYGPMQAFYLTTGIGRPGCREVPDDGMVVQTPQGVGTINLLVNEVEVEMGSTVYFNVSDERTLQVQPIEGAARVQSNGKTQTVVAGTQVDIPLNDDFSAMGEPSEPESYLGDEDIEFLPLDPFEREIEREFGLDDEEFALFTTYEDVFENVNVDDVDDVFDYIDNFELEDDVDLPDYLINELGYTDFDDELEDYFEEEGYDLGDYDLYTGDDEFYYDTDTYDGGYSDDGYDGGEYDGGYDGSYDGYDDGGYDGYDGGDYDGYDGGDYDDY